MNAATIVISRCDGENADRRAFEDAVIRALEQAGRASVLVVPSLYSLADGDKALDALGELKGNLVIGSSLFPRAAYWVLHARGVRGGVDEEGCEECCSAEACFCGERKILAFNFAVCESPDEAVRRLLSGVTRRKPRAANVREIAPAAKVMAGEPGAAGRSVWCPVIDYSRCVVCGQCHDFCLFGVYSTDDSNQPQVTAPDNCKPGCAACARICPEGAIMFPLYEGDEGIAGAPGKRPRAAGTTIPESFFRSPDKARGRRGDPCPVCGCACDCQRSTDGTAPPGKTVCPACGCICDASGPCVCRPKRADRVDSVAAQADRSRDELDDLIDELDKLDV
jgi:hypothetical protein